jgi:hypothetical protein
MLAYFIGGVIPMSDPTQRIYIGKADEDTYPKPTHRWNHIREPRIGVVHRVSKEAKACDECTVQKSKAYFHAKFSNGTSAPVWEIGSVVIDVLVKT